MLGVSENLFVLKAEFSENKKEDVRLEWELKKEESSNLVSGTEYGSSATTEDKVRHHLKQIEFTQNLCLSRSPSRILYNRLSKVSFQSTSLRFAERNDQSESSSCTETAKAKSHERLRGDKADPSKKSDHFVATFNTNTVESYGKTLKEDSNTVNDLYTTVSAGSSTMTEASRTMVVLDYNEKETVSTEIAVDLQVSAHTTVAATCITETDSSMLRTDDTSIDLFSQTMESVSFLVLYCIRGDSVVQTREMSGGTEFSAV